MCVPPNEALKKLELSTCVSGVGFAGTVASTDFIARRYHHRVGAVAAEVREGAHRGRVVTEDDLRAVGSPSLVQLRPPRRRPGDLQRVGARSRDGHCVWAAGYWNTHTSTHVNTNASSHLDSTYGATHLWCSSESSLRDCCQPGCTPRRTSGRCSHTGNDTCSCCWWSCRSPHHHRLFLQRPHNHPHKVLCSTSVCSFPLKTPEESETLVDRGLLAKNTRVLRIFQFLPFIINK